ncbi:MAG: glycosyltransferase family 39 protein [Betaproteobacteria bacterium]|nr:glycosyltransferase family 39 protein [Betaproteobacteria bacterium]
MMTPRTGSLLEDLRSHPWLTTFVAVGVVLSFYAGLGQVPLFDLDEGAFTEATREMLLRGDHITTFLNGAPRFDKPVLIYWLQAVSVTLLGQNEFAFRLPSAICSTVWVLAVFLFVRRIRDTRTGLVAAAFTATAAGITVIGRAAIADALLNMLLVVACTTAYLYLAERDRRWLRASFVAIGFGLLAKGPVAVLIPFATTFLYCWSRRELAIWVRGIFDPVGLALMLAIAAPWYVAEYMQQGDAFIQGFLMKHNVGRFSSPMHGFNGSVFYYVPWLFIATLPFFAPVLNVFRRLGSVWHDDAQRFCLIWFAFVFVFFSFSGTKLPHYAFYGYSGLFVIMACNVPAMRSHVAALIPAALIFAALAALPFAFQQVDPHIRDPYYREALADIRNQFGVAYYVASAALVAGTLVLMRLRTMPLDLKLVLTGCATAAVMALFILPVAGRVQQLPIKEAALLAKARDYHVVMWGLDTPSFIVYSGRLVEKRDPKPGEIALAKVKRLHELPAYEVLYRRNGIALVRVLEAPR